MIVLEKWLPNKPISVVYFDGERSRYYVKRFMIEQPDKVELFISDHPNSKLEIVVLDYRPMAEIVYSKRSLENEKLNFEEFIAIKGIKALGNQLTIEKIKQVNLVDPLPYIAPEIDDVEVIEEEVVENGLTDDKSKEDKDNENGQTAMF